MGIKTFHSAGGSIIEKFMFEGVFKTFRSLGGSIIEKFIFKGVKASYNLGVHLIKSTRILKF